MLHGRIHLSRLESRILASNPLGDSPTRDLYLYLPPSYDHQSERRFPVAYLLAGFAGRGRMFLNDNAFSPDIAARMDKLIAANTVREMIVVLPDCFTRLGGSQYINSVAVGDYEDHITHEVVRFVDDNFRTLPDRSARAILGKSSGGYGALVLAMRHPDLFSCVASHSGDMLFEYPYLPDFPKAFRLLNTKFDNDVERFVHDFLNEERKGKDDFALFNIIAMSACYSPDIAAAKLKLRLPFNLETGEPDRDVWARWLTHDPIRMIEREPTYRDALRSLRLLYLDAGTRDEFSLDIGARAFAARLRAHHVSHLHEEHDGGHFHTAYRYDCSLALISEALNAER